MRPNFLDLLLSRTSKAQAEHLKAKDVKKQKKNCNCDINYLAIFKLSSFKINECEISVVTGESVYFIGCISNYSITVWIMYKIKIKRIRITQILSCLKFIIKFITCNCGTCTSCQYVIVDDNSRLHVSHVC